jgi:hypothetical protein
MLLEQLQAIWVGDPKCASELRHMHLTLFLGSLHINDLARTLWCARCDLDAEGGPVEELVRLGRLVGGYDAGLEVPLAAVERAALPVAMARQPLSSIGGGWPAWTTRLQRWRL